MELIQSYNKDEFENMLKDLEKRCIIKNIQYSTTNIDCLADHGKPKILYSAIAIVEPKSI